jgi:hypothetical protein
MSLHWSISHPKRLVIAVAKGTLQAGEVVDFLARLDADGARPYAKMFDITPLASRFDDDSVRALAVVVRDREQSSEVGPLAVVASSDDTYRQATLFAEAAHLARPIKVFRELHEARRWLDSVMAAGDRKD